MRSLLAIAGKELTEAVRNRWVVAATLLLGALALSLTLLGSTPTGTVGVNALDVVIVSLSSLGILLLPLIALLISHDALVGEVERGTMLLLLAYPVTRRQIVLGKFLGHMVVLAIATLVGFGAAGVAVVFTGADVDRQSWEAFGAMIGSSLLLGGAFVAIGYCTSALARSRAAAAAVAICLWLLFVVVYDLALLGVLVADQGAHIGSGVLETVLLFNPTDAYRLLNLTGFANVSLFSGMAGLGGTVALGSGVLLAALVGWILLPLGLATALFARREL
ncbi:MAG: ABC transporter permease [Rhodoplanes sp.]|uniref:ABC transporter permease subunit n=1 Tax=Rhodoplanes sp. TaxID=1968906 RepID=UPI0017B11940|nr:ABC transporter permease subunit [Rhodoplanes sp.]NVO12461.1 ABC transporter permease [Rhodoplanes sp.]